MRYLFNVEFVINGTDEKGGKIEEAYFQDRSAIAENAELAIAKVRNMMITTKYHDVRVDSITIYSVRQGPVVNYT